LVLNRNSIPADGSNNLAEHDWDSAYAFRQMKTKPKSIYLFLSSEKDFAAFCRILRKTRKCIETIDAVAFPLFSGCSWNVP
jgi:hypothetical protein